MCKNHLQQANRANFPKPVRKTPEERFWAKVDKTGDCWIWTAGLNGTGYGSFKAYNKPYMAHRFVYEMLVGSIPDGMVVDHTCHVRTCVRPDHLRAATQKQNMENRDGPQSNSKSGVQGVTPCSSGKWRADVIHNGRQHYLGRFDDVLGAEAAVIAKRLELFTHNDADRKAA
jgi:hypothetical protein